MLVRAWVAHPTGRRPTAGNSSHDRPAFIAIGPEGGLTDDETAEAVAAGWDLISLGSRILRIETAAIALTSYLTLTTASNSQLPESPDDTDKRR
jgi:16S rRNA (uracil1498-N3)-methyltransferase